MFSVRSVIERTQKRIQASINPSLSSIRYAASKANSNKVPFHYEELLQSDYKPHASGWNLQKDLKVETLVGPEGRKYIKIPDETISILSERACTLANHLFRSEHLQMVARICKDPDASDNDVFVAKTLLENAVTSAEMILPSCQDTGTVIIIGKRGHEVITGNNDASHLTRGVYDAYDQGNLRFSQVAATEMFVEKNTKTNLPAQIDIYAKPGCEYEFLFIVKGGGSANKTNLFQKTKATLNDQAMTEFLSEKILQIGTAACPPYHLAVVIGGQSAEQNLKMVKLASTKYLDNLPHEGSAHGRAFRDLFWETEIRRICREMGIGAQFGGKYFVHDVRVIRLPRHGASCPIGIGVSCSADRQILAKVTPFGVFLENLETKPEQFLDEANEWISKRRKVDGKTVIVGDSETTAPHIMRDDVEEKTGEVKLNLNKPMQENCDELSRYPVKTLVRMSGDIVVARDIAHARLMGRLKKDGKLPDYIKQFPVYYAGPAKVPKGYCTGSFGPTTSSRMDPYVESFQEVGGSRIMIGKGNRGDIVTDSCKNHQGFYLGGIGGTAATLSFKSIKSVQVLDMEELGMEAVWKINVEDFPAFLLVDDKGNDFFREFTVNDTYMAEEYNSSIYALLEWFEAFDRNKDMILQADELSEGFGITIERASQLVKKYDLGNFGGISIDEFVDLIQSNDGEELFINGKSARVLFDLNCGACEV